MSITRRDALAAVIGCGLTITAVAGAGERQPSSDPPRPDPVFANVPVAIRSVFESTFPNHQCVRMALRQLKGAEVYRGTFFDPASTTVRTKREGEEIVTQPILFHLEVSADAKIIEETPHPIDPKSLPKGVAAAYEKWNPKRVERIADMWTTEVPRGKDRVYGVHILVSAIESYSASFKEDGSVVAADPVAGP